MVPLPRMMRASEKILMKKQAFSTWLQETIKERDLNLNQVAKAIGVTRSSLTRWTQPNYPTMPSFEHISRLVDILGSTPPGWSPPVRPADAARDGVLRLAMPSDPAQWNGFLQDWRVTENTMTLWGYKPGDVVRTDARITPVDGDVVVATLHLGPGPGRFVLRLFKAPMYVVAADGEVHEARKNAEIIGVVIETTRRRPPET
jgi:transcriptional regulator with XRE-family HTH domain